MDSSGIKENLNLFTLKEELQNSIELSSSISSDYLSRMYKDEVYRREFSTETNQNLHALTTCFAWDCVMLLGLGGIGSWSAIWFSRLKYVDTMILIDPDYIEPSNLNRTPFGIDSIGDSKLNGVCQKISENNPIINLYPYNRYFDEDFVNELKNINPIWKRKTRILVVDCRDDYFNDYHLLNEINPTITKFDVIRLAYNGGSITIDFNPVERPVMGEGGYSVQPSHILPSALAGLLTMVAALNYKTYQYDSNKQYLFQNPTTFDSTNIIEYIHNGLMLRRMASSGDQDAINFLEKLVKGKAYPSEDESKSVRFFE